VVSSTTISRLISVLEVRLSSMLSAGSNDFTKEGVKGKIDQRKSVWYESYKSGMSTVPDSVRGRLSKTDAMAVVSLLAEHWTTHALPTIFSERIFGSQCYARPLTGQETL
jgi:hypothetical protein